MTNEFLTGEKFSSGYRFEFKHPDPLEDRFSVFEKKFLKKSVLHVGCVDHLPVIEAKMRRNTWVHNRIANVTSRCIGFDINGEGIAALRSLNVEDVYEFDACSGQHESTQDQIWDFMFIGEVLEHIDNPVDFLSRIRREWMGRVNKLVLTVPNAFCAENEKNSRKGYEMINSDHRYWFTPYTVSKVLVRGGFQEPKVRFIAGFPVANGYGIRTILRRRRLAKHPPLRTTLLAECDF